MQLCVFFVRHGIQDTIKEYTTAAKIEEMNKLEQEGDVLDHMNEKQKMSLRLQDMKMIMDSLEDGDRK